METQSQKSNNTDNGLITTNTGLILSSVTIVAFFIGVVIFITIKYAKKIHKKRVNLRDLENGQRSRESNRDENSIELNPVNDSYESKDLKFVGLLGEGQFGEVRLAEVKVDGKMKKVAVKVLKSFEKDDIKSLEKEKNVMKSLDHENVLKMLEISLGDKNNPMIVMPFMENGCLLHHIRNEEKVMNVVQLLRFAIEVADGK